MSITSNEVQVLVIGKTSSENVLWGKGKILKVPLRKNVDLSLGKFYVLKEDQNFEAMSQNPYVTKEIILKKKVHILVQAPVFIGNQHNSKQYIGCSNFFGRVFVDNTFSSVKLQQFKTYVCCLEFSVIRKLNCFWKSRRVISQSIESPLECFMVHAKVDSVEEDCLVCSSDESQGELQLRVERSDLQEYCFEEVGVCMPITIVYLNFFDGGYLSCFATLRDDFQSEILQKAPLINLEDDDCCGPHCERVFEILRTLISDTYFWENMLADRPDLRERLLNLFL